MTFAKVAALAAVFISSSAFADTITLEAVNGQNDGQYYVGPVSLGISGSDFNGTFTAMCDDFTHRATVGQSWQGIVFGVNSVPAGSYFTQPEYEEEAYVFSQMLASGDYLDWQYVSWDVTDPGAETLDTQQQADLAQVNSELAGGFAGFNFSDYHFAESTPGSSDPGQGFCFVTPEPSTFLLLGASGFALALFRRKLRKA